MTRLISKTENMSEPCYEKTNLSVFPTRFHIPITGVIMSFNLPSFLPSVKLGG